MSQKNPDEIKIKYYETESGSSPFRRFFERIGGKAAARISAAITQLQAGNTSDSKSVGKGVSERRIHSGSGYRLFYGWDNDKLIILLSGAAKKPRKQQTTDIKRAQEYWADYKSRKRKKMKGGK